MDELDQPEDDGFALVMPFLPVASVGGPFDDEAYVAGYEAGRTDVTLSTAQLLNLVPDTGLLMHKDNAGQADLIAMRYGFTADVTDLGSGWIRVDFTKLIPDDPG